MLSRSKTPILAICVSTALLLTCKPPVSSSPSPSSQQENNTGRSALRIRPEDRSTDHSPTAERASKDPEPRPVRPFQRCFPEDGPLSPPRSAVALLDRAGELYDQGERTSRDRRSAAGLSPRSQALLEGALVCAEEAARGEPRSVDAHYQRAVALLDLSQVESARDAFSRALALDPDDLRTLAGAADLYINHLTPGVDHTETGLEYARRGSRRARKHRDKGLVARLALLEGQALNDLGHSREAVSRLDAALSTQDPDVEVLARYERAVAYFDLCRFEDARRGFADVTARTPEDAWAHQHLGLVLEALGRQAEAERAFHVAHQLQPNDFPKPLQVSDKEFRDLVRAESSLLPAALAADLAQVSLETADLPDLSDLTAEEPPLSPTILGLFRGTPLGEPNVGGQRTIILYRKNLLRAVNTREDLITQIRTTLLHELGHLRGEDDEALRARGLE